MALRSTYFLKVFAMCIALSACVSESFVDTNYSPTVSGYKRNQAQTGNIQPRPLTPANAIAANAALAPSSPAPVMVNNPFAFSNAYAPSPAIAAPVYSAGNPYGSLGNSNNGVISSGVFMPSYSNGYQPPAYGGTYSPVR